MEGLFIFPSKERFHESEMIGGVFGGEIDGAFQVLSSFRFATDAGGPAGSIQVKHAEGTFGRGVVEFGVQSDGALKRGFHIPDEGKGAERFCAGELAFVHGEVEVGGGVGGSGFDRERGGGNPFVGESSALSGVGRKLGPFETGLGKLPGCGGVRGLVEIIGPGRLIPDAGLFKRGSWKGWEFRGISRNCEYEASSEAAGSCPGPDPGRIE